MESLVSIVAPLEPEAVDGDAVEAFVDETIGVLRSIVTHYEIVLVDDGAAAAVVARARELLGRYDFVRLLTLSRHFGEETAIAAGLDVAIGDYVVVMLPNTDPPELIPRFLDAVRADADIVYGVRLHRRGEPGWYRLGARVFYAYINRVAKAGIPADSTQYRCMTRQVVNAILQIRDPDRYLRLLTSYIGFRKQPLTYAQIDRTGRVTVRPKREALDLAGALIMQHTTHPLRVVSWAVVALAVLNLFAAASLHAVQFLGLSVSLALVGEYVGGLWRRMRDRPAYYVREEQTSSVLLREERANVVDVTSVAGRQG